MHRWKLQRPLALDTHLVGKEGKEQDGSPSGYRVISSAARRGRRQKRNRAAEASPTAGREDINDCRAEITDETSSTDGALMSFLNN